MPPCLIGMEACVGAHHLSRKLNSLGHDARLMPAKYVRPYSKGQKNDFRDAEAIVEAVQRPTMKFVATKTYPASVRHWIEQLGGLSRQMIYMEGRELQGIIATCDRPTLRALLVGGASGYSGTLRTPPRQPVVRAFSAR
jgi:hypothetical protein